MKITIPTTSIKLFDILGSRKDEIINDRQFGHFNLTFQNLGTSNIYIDSIQDASIEESVLIVPNNYMSFDYNDISRLNIISEGAINDNVRLLGIYK